MSRSAGPPDPLVVEDVRGFVRRLASLKVWAGNPSFDRLARLSGVPRSTLADALSERRKGLPALDVVRRMVTACGLGPDEVWSWEVAWRRLQQADADQGTAAAGTAVASWPALLPADLADFVGRHEEVARLVRALAPADEPGGGPVVLRVITGRGGVGKTALAVRVAHRLAGRFPDGQLYVDLRGASPDPVDPAAVLGRFLQALGVAGAAVPAGLDERAELYRGLLAGRRVLVVLDNARSAGQVAALLPGAASCAVLATSRFRLTDLPGARWLDLGPLRPPEALELLGAVIGPERAAGDPRAAHRIGELCGLLPLTVRIAAARLAARPHRPLAWLVDRLSDGRRRLSELAAGDLDVRSSLALSYRALAPGPARALRLLTVLKAVDFPAWIVGPLLEVGPDDADELVDSLTEAYLLEHTGTDPSGLVRYRMHDLVRLFADERCEVEDDEAGRRAAVARVAHALLVAAERADTGPVDVVLPPVRAPLQRTAVLDERHAPSPVLLDGEGADLALLVEGCCASGLPAHAWTLAAAYGDYFDARGLYVDGLRLFAIVEERCVAAGTRLGEAMTLLGRSILWSNGFQAGDSGRMESAAAAVERFTDLDQPFGRARALEVMAYTHHRHGRPDEALTYVGQALDGLTGGHADLPVGLWLARGITLVAQGRDADAAASYRQALTLSRQHGMRLKEALVLRAMGSLHRRRGELGPAEERLRQALDILDSLDHAGAGASTPPTGGQDTRVTLESALAECHRLDLAFGQALALGALGDVHRAQGRFDLAVAACTQALAVAERLGEPLLRALTQSTVGAAHRARSDRDAAREAWSAARDLHSSMGNRAKVEELDRHLAG